MFDDVQVPGAASGTLREIEVDNGRGRDGRLCVQQASTQFQQGLAVPVGQKSEMADAHEALGQYVQEEAPQELTRRKHHLPLLITVGVVPPKKRDIAVGDFQDAVIGDSHAVSVAGQVSQDLFRASEGRFGVNHPLTAIGSPEECLEGGLVLKCNQIALELEPASAKCGLQELYELAAEHTAQNLHR